MPEEPSSRYSMDYSLVLHRRPGRLRRRPNGFFGGMSESGGTVDEWDPGFEVRSVCATAIASGSVGTGSPPPRRGRVKLRRIEWAHPANADVTIVLLNFWVPHIPCV